MRNPDACAHARFRIEPNGFGRCLDCGVPMDEVIFDEAVDPDVHWWEGPVECDLCGHGKAGSVRAVVPIPRDQAEPLMPLQCSGCGNMTAHPQ